MPIKHMEKRKHPTLTEVAKKASVGTTTVSRVINGGQNVDPRTLARVQRVIAALGYMPNQAARTLKGDRTRIVGLIIPSIADPFFSRCAEAAQAIARSNDSLLIVLTTGNKASAELDAVNVLLRHRVDGFMIAPCNAEDDVLSALLKNISIPVVSLDRPITGSAIASVVAENYAGAHLATTHLLEHGYKRIVCLTGEPSLYTIKERIRGYCDAMKAAGLEPLLDSSLSTLKKTEDALGRLLTSAHPPQALFTLKNSTTIDVFQLLQKRNIAIPDQVALLGYDDFQLAELVQPSITVIEQPIDEMGQVAAETLFAGLLGDASASARKGGPRKPTLLKTTLIRRASCGCVPVV